MTTDSARFWVKVDYSEGRPDACWPWKTRYEGDYPSFSINKKKFKAHRVSWFFAHGEWPTPGLVVMHKCDNPRCVRPSHLQLGTVQDNVDDRVRKGRSASKANGRGGNITPWTYCRRGHEFSPENSKLSLDKSHKQCRECLRLTTNKRRRERGVSEEQAQKNRESARRYYWANREIQKEKARNRAVRDREKRMVYMRAWRAKRKAGERPIDVQRTA